MSASLILADGTVFSGQSFGAPVDTDGEVVFNTGMVGYPESMTDPSYRGQILTFTYPLIGNYGVPSEELNEHGFSKNFESENIHVRAIVVSKESRDFNHFAAKSSLHDWMIKHKIPGISGIDTRALTKQLRETGVMLGRVVQDSPPDPNGIVRAGKDSKDSKESKEIRDPNLDNLVAEVSCKEVITYEPTIEDSNEPKNNNQKPITIVAYDCGMKRNIIRSFLKRGVRVHRVPWNYDLSKSDLKYDGVFVSNGPGDPKVCKETIKQIAWVIQKNLPFFGICLGNQLLALAIGGDTYKLKYGHRGANQPCIEIQDSKETKESKDSNELKSHVPVRSGDHPGGQSLKSSARCIITSQNHGFAVDEKTLPKGWSPWFTNANDGTNEGIRHESGRFFSVQFHPEATPGPEDAGYLFAEFLKTMTH